jgi:hypothetical protein
MKVQATDHKGMCIDTDCACGFVNTKLIIVVGGRQ